MPVHLPHLGGHHRKPSQEQPEGYVASSTSTRATRFHLPEHPHRQGSSTSGSSASTSLAPSLSPQNPTSILRKNTGQSSSTAESEVSSSSGSAFVNRRMSTLSIDRTDTIDSAGYSTDDDRGSTSVTSPGTSVSSLGHECPLPPSSEGHRFPFFVMTLSSTSTLSFIALPLKMRPMVISAINRAWHKGISKSAEVEYLPEWIKKKKEENSKVCEGGVWEVTMKDSCWNPSGHDRVASKRIMLYLLTEFAKEGYSLTSSFRTSAKDSGKDTMTFLRGEPDPDPIFFAVAFHSQDRIWIIDAEADVGQHLEERIKEFWTDGITGIRTRERHCREIRLRGNPWTTHSVNGLISVRCVHLLIMKTITHFDAGYDFVGSIDMEDREESGIALTVYRAAWGASRARWSLEPDMSPKTEKPPAIKSIRA